MKKFLLFAVMASAMLAGSAMLPERSIGSGRQMKALDRETARVQQRNAVRRAADGDSETAIAVPFTHTLGKNTEVNDYLIVDANGDGRTWKPGGFTSYSVCMAPNAADVDAADDWMISPAVRLEAGVFYTVSYEEDMTLNKTEDKLGLFAGTERSAEGMTITVIDEHAYGYTNKVFTKKETQFSVAETGNYYFGFHCTSEKANSGTPKVCNFSIQVCENPVVAPEKFVEVPFTHTLGKNTEVNDYIIVDADNDTRTWKPGAFTGYSVCMKPTEGEANNDWLISLPVHLLPGVNYTLSYEEGFTLSSGKEDILGIYYGTEPEPAALTLPVVPAHAITARDFAEKKTDFTVAKEGYYYFGFHCTSETANSGNLKICNFAIKESTEDIVPPAAGTLEVTPAPLGELKATVKYTAPTVNANGEPLSQLSKVIITTNWAFKTELTEVVPGGEYTIETTDVYNNAYNRVEAVAYLGDVAGEAALVTDLFFGMDNPRPVTGVKAVLSDDYKTVTLSWDPITEVGEKGGYVDASKAVYYVFDAFGSYYDPALITTTETSATFDYSDAEEQDFVAFQVTAGIDETYYSLDASSNIVVIGRPEALPFHESFADGYYTQMWVVDPESQGQVMNGTVCDNELQTNTDADEGVEPEYLNSHDADNGFFLFMPIDVNSSHGFYSAKISLEGAENPVFEFWYQGKGSVLDAKLGVDGGEMETISSIDLKENPTDDWTLARIDLTPYKSANYIQVGVMVRAIHNTDDQTWSVPFDNLRVIDLKDEALRVSVAAIPDAVKSGEELPVCLTVENIGRTALTSARIAVSADTLELEPIAIESLAPGAIAKAKATVATSVLSPDAIHVVASAMTNAETTAFTIEKDVTIQFPALPYPTDIYEVMTSDGFVRGVYLAWEKPEFIELTKPKVINEDFENSDYEPFTYSDFAGFKFVDIDGKANYTFLDDVNNPYRTQPMAYQLFSPEASGMPQENLADCPTHSGNTMLVAWSNNGQNANLLISPELTGKAQTISFWARGFTVASGLNETFSVWVSDTDTEVKSFTQLHEVENYPENGIVPEEWTEFKVTVPEGTKYFGILHDSYDSYALFIDDITFKAAGVLPSDTKLTGYNVYCDGKLLPDMPTDSQCIFHDPGENGIYNYRVSALYNYGESRASEPYVANFHRVSIAEIEGTGITLKCENRVLTVNAPEGMAINVIDIAGRIIASGTTNLSATVPASDAVVLVTIGSHVVKALVK
ncbi:MAG: hypothetical protein HDR45_01205 [Bacteroides sp.]|nr:hypothetical protein [Bacteroides sp.]